MTTRIQKLFYGCLVFSISFAIFWYFPEIRKGCDIIVDGTVVNFSGVEDFIVPFINYTTLFYTAPKYKLISCGLRKSMTQLTMNLMCLLYNEQQYFEDNNSLNDTWKIKRRCLADEYNFYYPTKALKNDLETVRFAFIRDPIQRFVSLYLDKCVHEKRCYKCGTDMRCIVENIYLKLKAVQENQDNITVTYMEGHAAPLSWNCEFNTDLSKWQLLMMGADSYERNSSILHLTTILKKRGVNETLVEKIQQDMIAGETGHSTHKSAERIEAERQVREDPFIRDLLHKIYFFDYVVFPFKRDHLDPKYQSNFWTLPK
ncbi:Carbohydrate sulfotransferase [Caenorhabditis elegans]|uniref:Carbohydrate sulfotransferase n=1 Tax=Caenorhabditis elegans TaxID=6239 RepID=O44721_CAEEL|nr:Carbohydrate sulfotransferase [Caenorhabditis elegans]CCD71539.1 Carbohydrate sulfotransferase [Caenorhabditis elegans]|eukprot:NP_492843.2 Uncharacterized protein CELE_F49D11.6 [Caenorhabditis elegans]